MVTPVFMATYSGEGRERLSDVFRGMYDMLEAALDRDQNQEHAVARRWILFLSMDNLLRHSRDWPPGLRSTLHIVPVLREFIDHRSSHQVLQRIRTPGAPAGRVQRVRRLTTFVFMAAFLSVTGEKRKVEVCICLLS